MKAVQIAIQFHEPDLDRVEAYRKSQKIIPTRAATIRGLVLLGLKAAAADDKRPSTRDHAT